MPLCGCAWWMGSLRMLHSAGLAELTPEILSSARTGALHSKPPPSGCTSLRPAEGDLVRALLAHTPDGDKLLLIVHHLGVDLVSWGILLADFAQGYRWRWPGNPSPCRHPATVWGPSPGGSSRSFRRAPLCSPFPQSPAARSRQADSLHHPLTLEASSVARLRGRALLAYSSRPDELVLAALLRALRQITGSRLCRSPSRAMVATWSSPRSSILGRTVGWFTTLSAVAVGLAEADDIGLHIKQTKEAVRTRKRACRPAALARSRLQLRR